MVDWKNQLFSFWAKLGQMLDSKVPITSALTAIAEEKQPSALKPIIDEMLTAIRAEKTMSEVLIKYPHLFPSYVVEMIKVGEKQNSLHEVAKNISESIQRGVFSAPTEDIKVAEKQNSESAKQAMLELLTNAVHANASDIHIQPLKDGNMVRWRIDGVLRERAALAKELYLPIITAIKLMAGLDLSETVLPQNGKFRYKIDDNNINFFVATMPSLYGEVVTLRIIASNILIPTLEQLDNNEYNIAQFKNILSQAWGLIVVTGPSGSGKTSTVYSMLNYINRPELKVMTIEDPVEYAIKGVVQTSLRDVSAKTTFPQLMRAILRSDPDVIFNGEIRSIETAQLCCQSALTGHLVFTVLHANSAINAMTRMVQMGLPPFIVHDAINAVVAQRLVRKLCPHCKIVDDMQYPELVNYVADGVYYKGKGCQQCMGTGYRGRTALFEIFTPNPQFREQFLQQADSEKLQKFALQQGMRTLIADGVAKARQGLTSLAEVLRVVMLASLKE